MNYTEEELCTLVDQLPDIQYNLQMPMTSINLLGLTPDLFDEDVYEILKDYFTEQKYNVLTTFLYHDTSLDMAGKVGEITCTLDEVGELQKEYKIGNIRQRKNGLALRVVGDELPEEAVKVGDNIDLEDVYLYYFE